MSEESSSKEKVKQVRLPLSPVDPKLHKKRKLLEEEHSTKPVKALRFDEANKLNEEKSNAVSCEIDGSSNDVKKCEEKENINLKKSGSAPAENNEQDELQELKKEENAVKDSKNKCNLEFEGRVKKKGKKLAGEKKKSPPAAAAALSKKQGCKMNEKSPGSQKGINKLEKNSRKRKMQKVDADQPGSIFKMFKKIEERGKQNLKAKNNGSVNEKKIIEIDISMEESDASNHSTVISNFPTQGKIIKKDTRDGSHLADAKSASTATCPSSTSQASTAAALGKEAKTNSIKRKINENMSVDKGKMEMKPKSKKALKKKGKKLDLVKGKPETKKAVSSLPKLDESRNSKNKDVNQDEDGKLEEKQPVKQENKLNFEIEGCSEHKLSKSSDVAVVSESSDVKEVLLTKETKKQVTPVVNLKKNKSAKSGDESQKKNSQKRKAGGNKPHPSIAKLFKRVEVNEKLQPLKESTDLCTKGIDGAKKIDCDNDIEVVENKEGIDEKLDSTDADVLETMPESDVSSELISDKEGEKTLSSNFSCSSSSPRTPNVSLSAKKKILNKSMTPKQLVKQKELEKKREEKEMLKLEKEKLKKLKEEEKLKAVEEKQKQKLEEQQAKEKDKEEKKLKREEERLKKEEEKQKKEEEKQKKEEEKQKKEEERLMKEEEKKRKEEEKKLAEVEEKEKKAKAKAMFAQFFVPKKAEPTLPQQPETEKASVGPFMQFQIKDNMRIAPIVRRFMTPKKKSYLDLVIANNCVEKTPKNYLEILKERDLIGKSPKTFPVQEKEVENYCEILDDEEDESIEGTDVEEEKHLTGTKKLKAKLLSFCENRRPAYYGTWSKIPSVINGRNPLGKEKVFDYEYDSDDDWEEEESGESLSDSEGEGEEGGEEGGDQYEVDNDFFVPHGYLSDDEGKDDEEEPENTDNTVLKDENLQKEQLKQKQEEFELEMKQKTKQLKPKVYGCVWVGDSNSHPAYHQLLKILSTHRAIIFCGNCPIGIESRDLPQDLKEENRADDEDGEELINKKFLKSFPEKAIPDLIRLVHGNRHSKIFLTREFSEYWKKNCDEIQTNTQTGTPATPSGGLIALRKIEPKIQELAQYGKYSEEDINHNYRIWFVPKEIRAKYGLENLSVENTWSYTLPLREGSKVSMKNEKDEKMECDVEDSPKVYSKSPSTNLITKFTKVLNDDEIEEEKKKNICCTPEQEGSQRNKFSALKMCTTPNRSKVVAKKRISLISVPKDSASLKNDCKTPKTSKTENKTHVNENKTPKNENKIKKEENKASKSESKSSISSFFVKNEDKQPPMTKPVKTNNEDKESSMECITIE